MPSRHRRDSFPSDEVVGGFFSILRPFGPRCPAQDFDYLSRVATHVEALQRAEAGVSEATETKRTLLRCVSTTLTGDTFACARSLHAALCASYTVCKAIDTVVRGEYRNAFCVVRPPGHHLCGNQPPVCGGVEPLRHRANAVTRTTSRRWRGASEI